MSYGAKSNNTLTYGDGVGNRSPYGTADISGLVAVVHDGLVDGPSFGLVVC